MPDLEIEVLDQLQAGVSILPVVLERVVTHDREHRRRVDRPAKRG